MLVGITIATITYLVLNKGGEIPSVFNPERLQSSIDEHVDDESTRERCTRICDGLKQTIETYDAAAASAVEGYLEDVQAFETSNVDLEAELAPLSELRSRTIHACIDAREELRELLDEETWSEVFAVEEDESDE